MNIIPYHISKLNYFNCIERIPSSIFPTSSIFNHLSTATPNQVTESNILLYITFMLNWLRLLQVTSSSRSSKFLKKWRKRASLESKSHEQFIFFFFFLSILIQKITKSHQKLSFTQNSNFHRCLSNHTYHERKKKRLCEIPHWLEKE